MEYTILLDREEVMQEVHLRNHYMGEALKRRSTDADILQSSGDDDELFGIFTREACNELIAPFANRFAAISYIVDERYIGFNLSTPGTIKEDVIPFLKQAIKEYLTNELAMQWLLLRNPENAQNYISLRTTLFNNVQQHLAKLCNNRVRRRATDLAGI